MVATKKASHAKPPFEIPLARPLTIAMIAAVWCAGATAEAARGSYVTNADVWLRVSIGRWILEHVAVPRTALFSRYPGLPWVDSTWGLDLLHGAAYRLGGVPALIVWKMLLQAALAIAVFRLVLTLSGRRWFAVLLSAVLVSLLYGTGSEIAASFLAIELTQLLGSLRERNWQRLRWLPLLFAVWANLDPSFLVGIGALLLLLANVLFQRNAPEETERLALEPVAAIAAVSIVACMFSPYGYYVYRPLLLALRTRAYNYAADWHALGFRNLADFALLGMILLAFFALGRIRSRCLFGWILLAAGAALSCAVQQMRWVGVIVACALISTAARVDNPEGKDKSMGEGLVAAGVVSAIAFAGLSLWVLSRGGHYREQVNKAFPVRACDFVRQGKLEQPLFNEYPWGGFLAWYLPEYPVSIDSRTDLYGDELNIGYMNVANGYIPIDSFPAFAGSRTLLVKRGAQLESMLLRAPQFATAYRDEQATVLVRKTGW